MAKRKSTFQDILDSVKKETGEEEPHDPLDGITVKNLPFDSWKENMFFFGGCDVKLQQKTLLFPATLKKKSSIHPVFLLQKTTSHSFRACPCSSQPKPRTRFIKAGCLLEKTGNKLDRNSYLLERYVFNLSRDPAFQKNLTFYGIVPSECINKGFR